MTITPRQTIIKTAALTIVAKGDMGSAYHYCRAASQLNAATQTYWTNATPGAQRACSYAALALAGEIWGTRERRCTFITIQEMNAALREFGADHLLWSEGENYA